ncbi:MAG: hypothetical protein EXR75_14050 [Myxococcales bacterium]|nr:hypothetical protein [Myxococcales bacterium]
MARPYTMRVPSIHATRELTGQTSLVRVKEQQLTLSRLLPRCSPLLAPLLTRCSPLLAPLFLPLVFSWAVIGCSEAPRTPAESLYVVPNALSELDGETFLDHPFPSDLRRDDDGTVRYRGFHNGRNVPILDAYVESTVGLFDGFSPAAAGYLRFSGAIDPATLPGSPTDALSPASSVQLIDVDADSPELGQRKLVSLSFRAEPGIYVVSNTLRWIPTLGFPLRPNTTYALVVTDAVLTADGGAVTASAALHAALGLGPASGPVSAHATQLAPALVALANAGVAADRIAHLAVFTTTDPTRELFLVRDHLRESVPVPRFIAEPEWKVTAQSGFVEYQGQYGPSPNYQDGALPFANYGDGGGFRVKAGVPEVVDSFDARFSLTVPLASACPLPKAGYPILLHAHGTGGDFRTHLTSGYARLLALRCIASMGVDQIFHGTRPGTPATVTEIQLLFFNFENPTAARTNGRQSALDEVQRARLFTETRAVIPASVSHDKTPIHFDASRVLFFGHSQGGLNGPLYLAADDSSVGGVLSGSGALIALALLEKTEPKPSVADLVRTIFLGLAADDDELDLYHPAIALAQAVVDAVDPIHYAQYAVVAPREGFLAKSIYMSEGIGPDGIGDSYTPPHGTEAHALAMGLPLVLPAQRDVPEFALGGPGTVTIGAGGLAGNLAAGTATGALVQWAPKAGKDGHFVVFDDAAAREQILTFLRSLAELPPGRIPAL